jgi:hypothetical protein
MPIHTLLSKFNKTGSPMGIGVGDRPSPAVLYEGRLNPRLAPTQQIRRMQTWLGRGPAPNYETIVHDTHARSVGCSEPQGNLPQSPQPPADKHCIPSV